MSEIDYEHETRQLILDPDPERLETWSDVVREQPELVDVVLVAYRAASRPDQRTAAVSLLPDAFDSDVHPVLRDFVGRVSPEAQDEHHYALTRALCILQEDWSLFDRYWEDLEAAVDRGRQLAADTPDSASSLEIVPGEGVGPFQFGATESDVIAEMGEPEDRWDSGSESNLKYPSRGWTFGLDDDSLRSLHISDPALEGLRLQHPKRSDDALDLPVTRQELTDAWGEPQNTSRSLYNNPTEALGYAGVALHFSLDDGTLVQVALAV
jgi:hypothetical protein